MKHWQTTLGISADVSERERALNSSLVFERSTRPAPVGLLRFFFRRGSARIFTKATDIDPELWRVTFGSGYKNFEYYRLIEDTVQTGFTYCYLALFDLEGQPIALQPLIIADQDLATAINARIGRVIKSIRTCLPRFLYSRMLMPDCLVGDGKLGIVPGVNPSFARDLLAEALQQFAAARPFRWLRSRIFRPACGQIFAHWFAAVIPGLTVFRHFISILISAASRTT